MKIEVKTASGRKVDVEVSRGATANPRDLRLFMQCKSADAPAGGMESTVVSLSGIESGTASFADSFWRVWHPLAYPADGRNVVPPPGLAVTLKAAPVTVDGLDWFAGKGVPQASLGALGQWYVDLDSGTVYKRTRGIIQKLAEIRAEEYDTALKTQAQVSALNLPEIPLPPVELTHYQKAALEAQDDERLRVMRSELKREMLDEMLADAEGKLYKKIKARVRDEVLNEQFKAAQSAKPAVEPEK